MGFRLLLALEVALSGWAAKSPLEIRRLHPDMTWPINCGVPHRIHGELLKLGIEVRSRRSPVHGEEWARAVTDLEDLSAQPCGRHRRDGLPDRADDRLSATFRSGHPQASTAATDITVGDGQSNGEWIAHQITRLSLGMNTRPPDPRP